MVLAIGGTVQPTCYGSIYDEHLPHDIWNISIQFGEHKLILALITARFWVIFAILLSANARWQLCCPIVCSYRHNGRYARSVTIVLFREIGNRKLCANVWLHLLRYQLANGVFGFEKTNRIIDCQYSAADPFSWISNCWCEFGYLCSRKIFLIDDVMIALWSTWLQNIHIFLIVFRCICR